MSLNKFKFLNLVYNNFNFRLQMPQIRKQPKRASKKIRIPSLRNPFLKSLPFLPQHIAGNLRKLDRITIRHID